MTLVLSWQVLSPSNPGPGPLDSVLAEDVISRIARVLDCRLGFVRWPERHETCSRDRSLRVCLVTSAGLLGRNPG
jgi:hypothetical protein